MVAAVKAILPSVGSILLRQMLLKDGFCADITRAGMLAGMLGTHVGSKLLVRNFHLAEVATSQSLFKVMLDVHLETNFGEKYFGTDITL